MQHTRGIMYQSGNAATKINLISSASFNTCLDALSQRIKESFLLINYKNEITIFPKPKYQVENKAHSGVIILVFRKSPCR